MMPLKLNAFKKIMNMTSVFILFIACSASHVDKASNGMSATFFVDTINGTSEISKVDSVYSLPKERLYNFKVCLKDIMQSKAILGQSFKIISDKVSKIINSDEQGCLNWSENIEYHFLAQSTNLELVRTILSNGVHKGSVDIKLIVNPWSHGEELTGVIDPSRQSVSNFVDQSKSQYALLSEGSHSPLWAIMPRVKITDREFTSTGVSMSLKFQTKLSLLLKTTSLQKIQYPISNGQFNVEMILYNSSIENGVEKLTALATSSQNNISFTQDLLIAEFPFALNKLPNKGQVLLGIRISTPEESLGIDAFEGIYLISDNTNIKIDGSPIPVGNAIYSEIKKSILGSADVIKEANIQKSDIKPGIEVEKLEIRFLKIGSESTTDRQIVFTVKACMKSNLDNRYIRDEEFLIKTVSDKNPVKLKSNQDGCVTWDDSIWHKFFGREGYIDTSISIKNENYKLDKKIDISVNPWDTGSTFGRDNRFVEELGSDRMFPSNEKAQMLIDSFSLSVSQYNYEMNKNLDLTLLKKGTLFLSAKVVDHSSLSFGRMGYQNLRDGKYLLKWSIVTLKDNKTAESVLSSSQQIVTAFGGDIKTDLEFKVSSFEKLNTRSRLVIALYTIKENSLKNGSIVIDKNSGLEATPFFAPIILNNDLESQKMQRLDDNLGLGKGDVFEKLTRLGSGQSDSQLALDKVLSSQNLKKISLSNEKESLFLRDGLSNPTKYSTLTHYPAYFRESDQKQPINSNVLIQFAKTGKLSSELAGQFCEFWFNDYFKRLRPESKDGVINEHVNVSLTQTCKGEVRKNPSLFFSTDKKLIVKKIGSVKYLSGTTSNFNVGTSFNVSKSENASKTSTWSWSAKAGLGFELFDIFKIGTDTSYTISSSKTKADSSSNSAQVAASTYLMLQTNTFNIELLAYEECTTIKLNPELFMGVGSRFATIWSETLKPKEIVKAATGGFFLCSGSINSTPVNKKENFYLITQDTSNNKGQQDGYAEVNHPFFMTLRGQKDLTGFLNLIQSTVKLPDSASSFEQSTNNTRNSMSTVLKTIPTTPGVYTDN